jgi:hypothetical protein
MCSSIILLPIFASGEPSICSGWVPAAIVLATARNHAVEHRSPRPAHWDAFKSLFFCATCSAICANFVGSASAGRAWNQSDSVSNKFDYVKLLNW